MIKKLLIAASAALALAACTDDYTDWASPQANEAEQAVSFGDGSVSPVALIDFATLPADQATVKVCSITAPTASDAAYTPEYEITLGDKQYSISAAGEMSLPDFKQYVLDTFGRRPAERAMEARLSTWVNNGSTAVKLTSGAFTVTAKPVAPVISSAYYIVGGTLDWATSASTKEQKFSHSSADVYDDPVFTITIPAAADADTWFAIGSEEACTAVTNGDWSQLLGSVNGNGANGIGVTEGLKTRAEIGNDGSFCVPQGAKFIKVTINMMDYTYLIEPISFSPFIYEIGNDSGWATSNPLACPAGDGVYKGFTWLDGEFKYKPNADNWDDDMEFASGDCWAGTLVTSGGPNIPAIAPGFYLMEVDMAAMTFKHTAITTIGLIGDATAKGWDGDTPMEWDTAQKCWTLTTTLADGTFKFRANSDWAINWGGTADNLTQDGPNVSITAGSYTIRLHAVCEGKSWCEIEAAK